MSARFARKPARHLRVEMTEIVLPEDTNQCGHAWGRRVMALIDKAAAIAATRRGRAVATGPIRWLDSFCGHVLIWRGHYAQTLPPSGGQLS